MEVAKAKEYVGRDSCIHWKDEVGREGGMSGVITEVGPISADATDRSNWVSVDWGYAVRVERICLIHLMGEECPALASKVDEMLRCVSEGEP